MSNLSAALDQIDQIILGKTYQIRLSVACLLAGGHLLIEDLPGVGKTTLAHVLAHTLGLDFQRIQFTSDLLPADLIGVSVYDRAANEFRFHPGPVFTQVILADEINRATPKSQSALLEAMEERQVTQDGVTHKLPEPFFVIATQNPQQQIGTFPLPESQLDRFLMRIALGYPDASAERALLAGEDRRSMIAELQPKLTVLALRELQQAVRRVRASDALLDYLQALLAHTRQSPRYSNGLSPRAGLGLLNAARAWALLDGRQAVLPEDLQAVMPGVAGHRLLNANGQMATDEDIKALLREVAIP
ncbi:MoxR family ATPase [Chitinivorax sp. B]|uniref:AAA family ATPase n=1 Tax=Chitinivorax sp. B TaxID=2502235 RepID=UPI0010F7F963|nr:MoxR family ATPase [Chitinivorax sp. B]